MKAIIALFLCTLAMTGQTQSLEGERENVLLILQGVLEGIAEQANIQIVSIQECVRDTNLVMTDLYKAVNLLKTNDAAKVLDGIRLIGEAIQVLPDAIKQCRVGEQDALALAKLIAGLLSELKHPWYFAFTVGKNLIVNGADIYQETKNAINDWDNQNYESFGKNVGRILFQLLAKASLNEVQEYVYSNTVTLEVMVGVIKGFGAAGGIKIDDVKACFQDTEETVNDFIGAVKDFETQDPKKILEGLKLLGQGLQTLPDAIYACRSVEQEAVILAAKLSAAISTMSDPKSFAFHVGKDLLINGKDIYKETKTAVDDWNTQNFGDFGYQVGQILYRLFVGNVNVDQMTIDIFLGVIRGFQEAGGIKQEDFAQCLGDTTASIANFIGAVKDFETQKSKKIIEGLKLLGSGLELLPEAIVACRATEIEYINLARKISLAIQTMSTPRTFAFHIGKDLLLNGRNIYKETKAAVVDWNNQDYSDFGYQVGKILEQVFVGAPAPEEY